MVELLVKTEPLYVQLRNKLMGFISEKNPAMLPDERSIADFYNVSRITVRKALAELEEQGIVERVQGRGTLVLKGASPAPTDLVVLSGMMDEYIRNIFATAVDEASLTGFNLNTLAVNADEDDIAMPSSNSLLNCLVESGKIASLLLLSRISENSISYLLAKKIPLLTAMFKYKKFDIPAVLDDYGYVFEEIFSLLLSAGIKWIAVATSHRLTESEDPARGLFYNVGESYSKALAKNNIPGYSLPTRGKVSIIETMEYFYTMPSAKRPQVLISPFANDSITVSRFLSGHPDWNVFHIKYDSSDTETPRVWTDEHSVIRAAVRLAAKRAERPNEHFEDIKIPASFSIPNAAVKKYLSESRSIK